ncbi:hypothetical protein LINPERHAP2_LOCUS32446 [Linum perenne]
MSTNYAGQVSLKLLIDKQTRKVVYAEAGKEFVDFLVTILSLPLGTVTTLLSKNDMIGCLGSLYKSIEDLNDLYIIQSTTQSKKSILNPRGLYTPTKKTTLLPTDASAGTRSFYMCLNSHNHTYSISVTEDKQAICPQCNKRMDTCMGYLDTANSGGKESGFVKGVVSYMIMDNLEVKPMSTVSIMAAFNRVNIKDVAALEEKVIKVTSAEVIISFFG